MDQLTEAISLLQSQQFANAETAFNNILESGETDTKIHQHLAESQLHQQKFTEAIDTLQAGLEITPEKPELLVYLSQVYWGTGQKDKAIAPHEKAVELMPGDMQLMSNMASMYYEMNRKDDAIEIFDKMLILSPHSFQIHFSIGSIHLEEARYESAIKQFEQGLVYDQNNSFANKQLGMALHILGEAVKAITHYEKALVNAQNDAEKLEARILLGNAHRDLNNTDEAKKYYEEALEQDPNNEQVKSNLSTLKHKTIPLWHFTMLADTSRNEAYDNAISNGTKPGATVLDIGTGSGLLSMMAARAGAESITAVEMVPELAEVARIIIAENNYSDVITVHEKRSTALVVGEELKEKADMVVSEILDAGLLGEGVIPSLRHAWSNLLKKDAVCIPKSADVYATIIQSDDTYRTNNIGEIQGFDLGAFNRFKEKKSYVVKQVDNIKSENLSEPFPVLSVDFYNLPEPATPDNPHEYKFEVKISKSGKIHGFMFWFTLHLDDNISMSSGPNGEMVHWGQAIQLTHDEQEVTAGDIIRITASQSDTLISFEIDKV